MNIHRDYPSAWVRGLVLGAAMTLSMLGCTSQERTKSTTAKPVSKAAEAATKTEAMRGLKTALLNAAFATQEFWLYTADQAMSGEVKEPAPAPERFCGKDASVKAVETIRELRRNFESANEPMKFKDSLKCAGSICELVNDAEAMYRFIASTDGDLWILAELGYSLTEEAKSAQERKLKAFLDHAKKSRCGTK